MKYKYLNTGGNHTLLDGTVIKNGGVFECDDPDLDKKFKNKITKYVEVPVVQATPVEAPVEAAKVVEPPATEDKVDATDEFPEAKNGGLVVKRDKTGYFVYDETSDAESVNEEPLKKKDVSGFVKVYLTE
jgi:hypothetical protein